ncbi:MAG: flagellar biosynthesis protein FlhB [Planctomycetes bacterium]|nr:flagellar biosynthesis protein FlhB [Planctomycetota bacterium]
MPEDDQGERTEAPTQRRREQSRQRGQVARSQDLSSAVSLLGALLALNLLGTKILAVLGKLLGQMLGTSDAAPWDINSIGQTVRMCGWSVAMVLAPLLMTVMIAGLLSNLLQVGILFTGEPLKPNLNKLSPLSGLKRLFSKRSLIRLVMSLGKVFIIGWIAYMTIASRMGQIMASSGVGHRKLIAIGGELVFLLSIRIGVVLLGLAILDYLFQRWQNEQDMKMTRHDLKEDLKRMEGDPLIRSRRQRVARQLAMQRMSQDVPRSTVVVTNPTHLAVALLYKDGMNAPRVLAKGADLMAIRIRQIAAASGVPIVERKAIAQTLFKNCRVGDEIPVKLYQAVAEILAYVYELSKHKRIGRFIPAEV